MTDLFWCNVLVQEAISSFIRNRTNSMDTMMSNWASPWHKSIDIRFDEVVVLGFPFHVTLPENKMKQNARSLTAGKQVGFVCSQVHPCSLLFKAFVFCCEIFLVNSQDNLDKKAKKAINRSLAKESQTTSVQVCTGPPELFTCLCCLLPAEGRCAKGLCIAASFFFMHTVMSHALQQRKLLRKAHD